MNKKEILKNILPELSPEEIEKLNQSIDRKNSTLVELIEVKEEAETPQPKIIDFNKLVDSEGAFLSLSYRLGEERRHEKVFNRVFDNQRDLDTINGYGWDSTVNWLTNNLHVQPERSMQYLITVYTTVKIMYLRNRANGVDQWNDDRFKEFEKWVFQSLRGLLPPSKNQILEDLNIDEETKDYFKKKLFDYGLLSLDNLIEYLKMAFIDKIQIEENKKLGFLFKPQNKIIYPIFYNYYVLKGSPFSEQTEYAALLGDYFKGYKTSTVSSSFKRYN